MSIGFDYKKYYLITTFTIDSIWKKDILTFVSEPEKCPNKTLYEDIIKKEVGKIEKETGAEFCHLYYKTYSLPFQFRFVFDMGLQHKSFKNKMKLKIPHRYMQIREDDHDYIKRLKQCYEETEVYERDGYTIFLFQK